MSEGPGVTVGVATSFAPVRAIREAVFVREQGFSHDGEFDAIDGTATHLLAFIGDAPVGTARLYIQDGEGRIGRIAVLIDERRHGIGAALVRAGLAILAERGVSMVGLSAQVAAIPFYRRLGFREDGPETLDEGVPHRLMRRTSGAA